MKGFIFYRGPSILNDEHNIVGIATLKTKNRKTGNLIQTWILPEKINPIQELHMDHISPICGNCPLRNNGCYVQVGKAPNAIAKAFKNSSYKSQLIDMHTALHDRDSILTEMLLTIQGRHLRMGAYGDPVAIPFFYWRPLVVASLSCVGYTHQWRLKEAQPFRNYTMASVETLEDATEAQAMGWKTFRIKKEGEPEQENESLCMNEKLGFTCEHCMMCNGRKRNITITAHGASKNKIFSTKGEN